MEKAYAKLHGNYEMINGDSMSTSLVDLTGGCSERADLRAPETAELIVDGIFWKDLKKYYSLGYLLGCSRIEKNVNIIIKNIIYIRLKVKS
jgi:hypothetical protein